MEILLILVLAVIVVPFCYYKGIKKGIDSVVWDSYVSNKISKEDKEKYTENSFITTTFIK